MTTLIKILRTVGQVRAWQKQCFFNKETVGFVPTMGALHQGHTYLVNQSLKENDRTIVLIFVNPSQFAPHEDLDAYPRTLDRDLQALEALDRPVDALFLPKVLEMFPSGIVLDVAKQKGAFVNVLGCLEQLEGTQRPAFFRGVSTIVTKFLNVIQPTNAYFGQKDAQQCVVVKNLVKDLLIDTTIRVCPTLRGPNGLAMSSRNAYLSQEAKDQCSIIYKGLCAGRDFYEEEIKKGKPVSAAAVADVIRGVFSSMPEEWNLEYIAVSHPESLEDLNEIESGVGATVSTAVRVPKSDGSGTARLIDNVQLHG
ncbi:pantoate-beta-alanine ligase [Candidozyma pseudohaemuli]|uniref:Pantoate--beta-alanine ligase n=1 Tax=Candidozyma pseudohaemuli TaxID=418784 RepID=A0A2P7YCS3_9ASCO|nr:pantoate-beta-alanine ligase [[Candida] pseudohaemulonii]PSK33778.1 pantoate-beta-alanine ligase [[Candida] pseudohaemulonii]